MVGIQRVMEGTDWPVCSAVYCVGMPGSLNTVVQLLGRAMRPKGEDYPEQQRDRARLVFFVPCGGGAALPDLSIDHSRHALLTCCFLADHEVGQEWIVLREIRRGIEAALWPARPRILPRPMPRTRRMNRLTRRFVPRSSWRWPTRDEQIISDGGEATGAKWCSHAAKSRPDLPERALSQSPRDSRGSTDAIGRSSPGGGSARDRQRDCGSTRGEAGDGGGVRRRA